MDALAALPPGGGMIAAGCAALGPSRANPRRALNDAEWSYFYLYLIIDIFSRRIVGWRVEIREAALLHGSFLSALYLIVYDESSEGAMAAEFSIGELTCFETAEDGSSIRLEMEDANGRTLSLHMPLECLNRLVITLPGMVRQAVQQRHRDPTLRVVYPVAQFQVEFASDYATRILTLQTPDGFSASFGLTEEQCLEISSDRRPDPARKLVAN